MATKGAGRTAGRLRTIQDALSPKEWGKVGAMTAVVVGLNVLGWAMLLTATGHHYHLTKTDVFGLGTGVLAYTLGMRHAFDRTTSRPSTTPLESSWPRASGP